MHRAITGIQAGWISVAVLFLSGIHASGESVLIQKTLNGATALVHRASAALSASNQLQHLDTAHDAAFVALNNEARRFDQRFAADPQDALATPDSRFRAAVYVQCTRDNGLQWRVDPDFDADIGCPNFERRLRFFIHSSDLGELPGVDPAERKNNFQAGLRHFAETLDIQSDLGVKGGLPPRGFAKVEWKPNWGAGDWLFYPRQRVFYETDDGFGELSSFTAARWLLNRTFLKSVSALRWTGESKEFEWEQSLIAGYVRCYLEEKHAGKIVNDQQTAQGISLRASVFGRKSSEWTMDRYRITVVYRRPLHRKWIYLELSPGVEWAEERNWDAVPNIRVGLDVLFWGPVKPDHSETS